MGGWVGGWVINAKEVPEDNVGCSALILLSPNPFLFPSHPPPPPFFAGFANNGLAINASKKVGEQGVS